MLQDEINKFQKEFLKQAPKEVVDAIFISTKKMVDNKLAKNSIKVGDTLKDTKLLDIHANEVELKNIITSTTVISLYRGSWCPYCNLELKALQNILPEINNLNANLIAISPEKPDGSLTFKEKLELEFDIFTDTNNAYAKKLGLVFKLEDHINEIYKEFGFDLKNTNGIDTQELPFPATFIVDKSGKIIYSFIQEDYTLRLEPSVILEELNKINKENT